MSLLVLGLNHRTAPIEVRERIVFDAAHLPQALAALARLPGVDECMIISTCNRTELYCVTTDGGAGLSEWLLAHSGDPPVAAECLYRHSDDAAIAHLFGVAAGLDSLILGEPQILGQLKDAYRAAQQGGQAGPLLNRLLQSTFTVAKRVRSETGIGASAVSIASAGVRLARRIFTGFDQHTALLVGAGDMIELAARHLHTQGLGRMIVANRSLNRAERIASQFQASAIALDAIPAHLDQADIVVSSTASPGHVIGLAAVQAAIAARRRRPMFMLDLAVPRDIDPRVAGLEDVYLFTLDDLRGIVDDNVRARQEEAAVARRLITGEVERFVTGLRVRDAVPLIRSLRGQAEATRQQTLEQAHRLLATGQEPAAVLEFLATTLTNRLLHAPSVALRDAAAEGDEALAAAAARLFQVGPDET